jgi:hypothetical protein
MQCGGFCFPASGCITPICISEGYLTLHWKKWNTQYISKTIKFSLFTDYFQHQYPDEITRKADLVSMKGVVR